MTINQMRAFIQSTYPNNPRWAQKVNKMPDEQVIAIYMNPHVRMPKNMELIQAKKDFSHYEKTFNSLFKMESESSPDYTICPHCGAHLDMDEHCDCYGPNKGDSTW